MLQRIGEDEGADFTGMEREFLNAFDRIHARSRLHIATDKSVPGKERAQVGDHFLPHNLEGADSPLSTREKRASERTAPEIHADADAFCPSSSRQRRFAQASLRTPAASAPRE
jgi:hypothetical protein